MKRDVFISFSPEDKGIVDKICFNLKEKKVNYWVSQVDNYNLNQDLSSSEIEKIENSKVMVLIFSSNSNKSKKVRQELEKAAYKGIPIIPFRIEDVLPSKPIELLIHSIHWMDALTDPLDEHIEKLIKIIIELSNKDDLDTVEMDETKESTKLSIEGKIRISVIIIGLLSTIIAIMWLNNKQYGNVPLYILILLPSLILMLLGSFPDFFNRKLNIIKSKERYKKIILSLMVLMVIMYPLVLIFGVNNISEKEISFNYPNGWGELPNSAIELPSIIGAADFVNLSSSGNITTYVLIQKEPLEYSSLKQAYDDYYAQNTSNSDYYEILFISSKTMKVGDSTAYEYIHKTGFSGEEWQQRDVWLTKNHMIYKIICVTKPDDFNNQQPNFDLIINSFRVNNL